jgi:Fe-S-cluster containining protein
VQSLEAELERARALDTDDLADAIESIGFECTRCGACCKAEADDHHTATVFPDEVRDLQAATEYDWRDVARPMPYGIDGEGEDGGPTGETFEWALQTDACGDCTFYEEGEATESPHGDGEAVGADGTGSCSVHGDRPLICETYPFSVALGGTSQPMGEAVDEEGIVRAHECEGLGRDISREDAEDLAAALKERAVRELAEAISVRDEYAPADPDDGVVVHDSEGAKRPDGSVYER